MYPKLLRRASACTLLLPLTSGLHAQELETIVVSAGRSQQDVRSIPVSISALSAKELGLIGAVHISEALARVPGAWISRGNGQENLTAIRSPVFTGTGSCGAFYLAEDGLPIRPSGFCNANALSEVDGEQADRIEVLRGPGTAVHGANAQHGVINVISPSAPRNGTESAVSLEGGANSYARVLARHGAGDADDGWLITLNAAHDGGYKDESGYDHVKFGLRREVDRESGRFRLQYRFVDLDQETASYVTGEGSFRRSDTKRDNPYPQAFRDNRVHRLDARWEFDRGADATLSITPYLRRQEMRFLQHFLLGQPLEENGADAAGMQIGWQQQLG
ncbi:MAG: TonB-dependent receptor, partial [Gammaproteobacteria bacterium]